MHPSEAQQLNEAASRLQDAARRLESQAIRRARETEVELLKQLSALITAAFGFVAALAWNQAVQAIFAQWLSASDVPSKVEYALFVSVVAVLLVMYISRATERAHERLRSRLPPATPPPPPTKA
jgi:hypothetical protein